MAHASVSNETLLTALIAAESYAFAVTLLFLPFINPIKRP